MSQIVLVAVFVLLVISLALSHAEVTPSKQCKGQNIDNLQDRVEVLPCGASSCQLKKGTDITVNFRFKPEKEVLDLRNNVYARTGWFGLTLPFVGVNGASACENIRTLDGAAADCPLAPHIEYLYSNKFHVEWYYPSMSLTVHWALNDGETDVICFEVHASISS